MHHPQNKQKLTYHKHFCIYSSYILYSTKLWRQKLWWVTTNLLKFYLPTIFILADLLCKAANLSFQAVIHQSFLSPKFCTIQYVIYDTIEQLHEQDRTSSDIICIASKLMNFRVTKINENNSMFYGDTNMETVATECFHDYRKLLL